MANIISPEELDRRFGWPLGRSAKLARRARLPYIALPDGSIRFDWAEIEAMVRRVPIAEPEQTVIA